MKISSEIIETFIEQAYRGRELNKEYLQNKIDEIIADNPDLWDGIRENAEKVGKRVDKCLKNGTMDSDIVTLVTCNLISACLSVYNVCKAQAEVNELEEHNFQMDH